MSEEIRPTGQCGLCLKIMPIDELSSLPEVEIYQRQYAVHRLKKLSKPEPLDTEAISKKYGIEYDALLCPHCFQKLTKNKEPDPAMAFANTLAANQG